MKCGSPISNGMSMNVSSRFGVPFGSMVYRLRQMPSTGRLTEKCAATWASLLGTLSVYHGIKLKNCQAGMRISFLRRDDDRGRPLELLSSISCKCFFSSKASGVLRAYLWLKMLSARRRPSRSGRLGVVGVAGSIAVGVATSGDSGPHSSRVSMWMVSVFSGSLSTHDPSLDLIEAIVFCRCR
jgi:hypothetical protein